MIVKIVSLDNINGTCFRYVDKIDDSKYPKISFTVNDSKYIMEVPTGYYLKVIKE